jgi:hypothetical protein
MMLPFNDSLGEKQVVGSIVFINYPNKSYTVSVDGRYLVAVYSVQSQDGDELGYDTVYFKHSGGSQYSVRKITTNDGLTLVYGDKQ